MTTERREYITLEGSPDITPLLPENQCEQNHVEERHQSILEIALSPLIDESGSGWGVAMGLLMLAVVGAALGLVLPQDDNLPTPWYRTASNMIGYYYFTCWSISFYPQVISNLSRKTTKGLSADFCGLNVIGFACYSVYNLLFFYSPTIQKMYKDRHHGSENTGVQSNDVAFAVHAFILSSITFLQIWYYDGFSALRPKRLIGWVMIGILCTICGHAVLVMAMNDRFNWLDFLHLLGYIKLFISLIKYIPQVILNFRRKSTKGWSIWNILLDFTGGTLSDLQLIMDCADIGDWAGITGNLAKLGLGSVSIVFDLIFMLQHYVLYPGNCDPSISEVIALYEEEDEIDTMT
mmetsp:Transcript_13023/g.20210  ORF Transcript_13023/g.20210 Transcript_13023/m.20210 type:complete len:349 (-) Transcript_13023:289-1335(-)